MKNIFYLTLVLFASLLIFSCRGNDIPEDTHEHEEVEKVTLSIVEKNNAANTQTINYIGGTADKNITLQNGKTYVVNLDFFTKHNNAYENMLDEIIKEKDQHFITYEFAGVQANVIRTANDIVRTDGKKMGMKTEWAVTSAPSSAKVNIKLYHGSTSVNDNSPSATNQLGTVTGGEADVNALITIQ